MLMQLNRHVNVIHVSKSGISIEVYGSNGSVIDKVQK